MPSLVKLPNVATRSAELTADPAPVEKITDADAALDEKRAAIPTAKAVNQRFMECPPRSQHLKSNSLAQWWDARRRS
jgi:hypothetical protein